MTRRRLENGENSIDTCTPFQLKNGSWCLRWKVRLWNGELKDKKTEHAGTKTELREKARNECRAMLSASGHAQWRAGDSMAAYVREVTIPTVEQSGKLRRNSIDSYTRMLRYYAEEVGNAAIADAALPLSIDATIKRVALTRSPDIARQMKKVVSKHVFSELVRLGVLAYNPLKQFDVDIPQTRKRTCKKVIPSAVERSAFVDWLASLAVADLPARGHSKTEDRLEVVDLAIVQATAGFRIGEMLRITGADVTINGQDVTIHITPDVSKTSKPRDCLLLDPRAAERVRGRVRRLSEPSALVFPAPGTGCTQWDESMAGKASKRLYQLASEQLGIESLGQCTSHCWRTALNDEWRELGVPPHERAAYLGHSEDINRSNYTAHQTLSTLYSLRTP